MSNDDGWAEINLRTFYNTLKSAGESLVVSAPAENKSGAGMSLASICDVQNSYNKLGSLDGEAGVVDDGCEFDSCPAGSPAVGFNSSDPRLNYVNSYPVTSMAYGISTLSPKFFQGPPDLAVTGPNVGGLRFPPSSSQSPLLMIISEPGHPGPLLRNCRCSR